MALLALVLSGLVAHGRHLKVYEASEERYLLTYVLYSW